MPVMLITAAFLLPGETALAETGPPAFDWTEARKNTRGAAAGRFHEAHRDVLDEIIRAILDECVTGAHPGRIAQLGLQLDQDRRVVRLASTLQPGIDDCLDRLLDSNPGWVLEIARHSHYAVAFEVVTRD